MVFSVLPKQGLTVRQEPEFFWQGTLRARFCSKVIWKRIWWGKRGYWICGV